jgi:hypothetical protein
MAGALSPTGTSVSMSATAVLQKDAELGAIAERALGESGLRWPSPQLRRTCERRGLLEEPDVFRIFFHASTHVYFFHMVLAQNMCTFSGLTSLPISDSHLGLEKYCGP